MTKTDTIIIRNAHTNNLKNIDLEIPAKKLVVFTGVSGSGKSSLLFDTIYTEAQRQLIETFSTFARTRMPKLSRPDVDDILNLSTAIVIDQKRMGNNLRSTVGTATEINTYLRLLYSRIGEPAIGPSFRFSFNHPEGMCPHCHGLGKKVKVDLEMFLNRDLSIREGAVTYPFYKTGGFLWKELVSLGLFDPDRKIRDYTDEELDKLLYSEPFVVEGSKEKLAYSRTFEGLARKLERAVAEKAEDEAAEEEKNAYTRYFTYAKCAACGGTRLNDHARSVRIRGVSIDELCRREVADVLPFIEALDDSLAAPILRKALFLARGLVEIGVGYLSLDRAVATLSGGESQRVRMARQLDCNLVNLLYVLDEPSVGLHPRDTGRLVAMLHNLRDRGNSVFVVEHDPDIIREAEWIVDMGPGAGTEGGRVVYNGEPSEFTAASGVTGRLLHATPERNYCRRRAQHGHIEIRNANVHNLQNVSVRIPRGVLTCVTGVSGSGKSSLVHECLVKESGDSAIVIDQMPVGRTSRANPATYTGIFDAIRKEFALATGAQPSLFSFNSKGACPRCNGQGVLRYELHFLDAVKTVCDACGGKRYGEEVLSMKYKGMNIADVLDMSVERALSFFTAPKIAGPLKFLQRVGLGYLRLGQPLGTLSGGESQRLKIASELKATGTLYVMDEPTTGLHMSDIATLRNIITSLVDNNNTVVVIEHNLDIIRHADWIIDMGPEGGKNGGRILFEGTPEELVRVKGSFTGEHLARVL